MCSEGVWGPAYAVKVGPGVLQVAGLEALMEGEAGRDLLFIQPYTLFELIDIDMPVSRHAYSLETVTGHLLKFPPCTEMQLGSRERLPNQFVCNSAQHKAPGDHHETGYSRRFRSSTNLSCSGPERNFSLLSGMC